MSQGLGYVCVYLICSELLRTARNCSMHCCCHRRYIAQSLTDCPSVILLYAVAVWSVRVAWFGLCLCVSDLLRNARSCSKLLAFADSARTASCRGHSQRRTAGNQRGAGGGAYCWRGEERGAPSVHPGNTLCSRPPQ